MKIVSSNPVSVIALSIIYGVVLPKHLCELFWSVNILIKSLMFRSSAFAENPQVM